MKEDRQCTCNVTWDAFLQPLLQWKSYKYYILCVCVCSLRYPAATRLRHIVMWPALLYCIFPHYLIKDAIFGGKKKNEHKMNILVFFITFIWNNSHSKNNWARYNKKSLTVLMYPLFLFDFNPLNAELNPICYFLALLGAHNFLHVSRIRINENWISSAIFRKNIEISNYMKIRPVGAGRTDGRTGRHDEASSHFS